MKPVFEVFLDSKEISVFLSLVLSVNRLAYNLTCYVHKAISLHLTAFHQNHHYFFRVLELKLLPNLFQIKSVPVERALKLSVLMDCVFP